MKRKGYQGSSEVSFDMFFYYSIKRCVSGLILRQKTVILDKIR